MNSSTFYSSVNSSYLAFSVSRGFSGLVTDIRRSQVTSVSNSVDDWQLKVLRKPANSSVIVFIAEMASPSLCLLTGKGAELAVSPGLLVPYVLSAEADVGAGNQRQVDAH